MAGVAKFIVAVVGAGVIALEAAVADGVIGNDELFAVGVAVLTALGVYLFPNRPPA